MKVSTRILILLVAGVLLLLFGRRMIAAGEASARAGGRPFWEKVSGGEGEKEQASNKSQRAQDVAARAERESLLARLWEQVLEQHPELVMERLPLAREEDAFYRYNELCEKVGEQRWRALRTGLQKFEEGEPDVTAARDFLKGKEELLAAARELVELPGGTLEDLPMGFIEASATFGKLECVF